MENNMGKTAYEYVTVYALLSLRLHTPYTTNESLNWFNQALTRSTNTNKKRREKNLFIPPRCPMLSKLLRKTEFLKCRVISVIYLLFFLKNNNNLNLHMQRERERGERKNRGIKRQE
jgi:hypothetical protein